MEHNSMSIERVLSNALMPPASMKAAIVPLVDYLNLGSILL